MAFDTDTNRGRARRISDALVQIQKSAKTNKVSADQIWKMLEEPIALIDEMVSGAADTGEAGDADAAPNTQTETLDTADQELTATGNVSPRSPYGVVLKASQDLPISEVADLAAVLVCRLQSELQE